MQRRGKGPWGQGRLPSICCLCLREEGSEREHWGFWKVGLDQAEEQGSLRGAMPLGRLKEDEVREKRSYSKSVLGLWFQGGHHGEQRGRFSALYACTQTHAHFSHIQTNMCTLVCGHVCVHMYMHSHNLPTNSSAKIKRVVLTRSEYYRKNLHTLHLL